MAILRAVMGVPAAGRLTTVVRGPVAMLRVRLRIGGLPPTGSGEVDTTERHPPERLLMCRVGAPPGALDPFDIVGIQMQLVDINRRAAAVGTDYEPYRPCLHKRTESRPSPSTGRCRRRRSDNTSRAARAQNPRGTAGQGSLPFSPTRHRASTALSRRSLPPKPGQRHRAQHVSLPPHRNEQTWRRSQLG